MESSLLLNDEELAALDHMTRLEHEEQMLRVSEDYARWKANIKDKQDLLEAGSAQQRAYLTALEEDAERLEAAAHELHDRLRLANEVIKKYQQKHKQQKKQIGRLKEELQEERERREAAQRMYDARRESAEHIIEQHRSLVESSSKDKEKLAERIAEKDITILEKDKAIECLGKMLKDKVAGGADATGAAGMPATLPAGGGHGLLAATATLPAGGGADSSSGDVLADARQRILQLEEELRIERLSRERLQQIVDGCDMPYGSVYIPSREHGDGLLRDTTASAAAAAATAAPHASHDTDRFTKLSTCHAMVCVGTPRGNHPTPAVGGGAYRADRAIIRSKEADYWIPDQVFSLTTEFKRRFFPKAPVELFYEYLVNCSKTWRCAHADAAAQLQKKHAKEVGALKKAAKRRLAKVDEIAVSINLRDLQRELAANTNGRLSGYVGRDTYVKKLRTAVNCLEELVHQVAALEEENARLRLSTNKEELFATVVTQFQAAAEALTRDVSVKCDDFQSLVESSYPHLTAVSSAVILGIVTALTQFSINIPQHLNL